MKFDVLSFLGPIISLVSSYFFLKKEPNEIHIYKRFNYVPNKVGIMFLTFGIVISIFSSFISNKELEIHVTTTENIDSVTTQALKEYRDGLTVILNDHKAKQDTVLDSLRINSKKIITAVLDNTDSALNYKLNQIEIRYKNLQKEYSSIEELNSKYYQYINWPVSEGGDSIISILMTIFREKYVHLENGADKYIAYYIIKNGGIIKYNNPEELENQIVLPKLIKSGIGNSLFKFGDVGIINEDYYFEKTIKLKEPYFTRSTIYNELNDWKKLELLLNSNN